MAPNYGSFKGSIYLDHCPCRFREIEKRRQALVSYEYAALHYIVVIWWQLGSMLATHHQVSEIHCKRSVHHCRKWSKPFICLFVSFTFKEYGCNCEPQKLVPGVAGGSGCQPERRNGMRSGSLTGSTVLTRYTRLQSAAWVKKTNGSGCLIRQLDVTIDNVLRNAKKRKLNVRS